MRLSRDVEKITCYLWNFLHNGTRSIAIAKYLFDKVKLRLHPRIDEMQRSSKSQKRLPRDKLLS